VAQELAELAVVAWVETNRFEFVVPTFLRLNLDPLVSQKLLPNVKMVLFRRFKGDDSELVAIHACNSHRPSGDSIHFGGRTEDVVASHLS